MSAIVYGPYQGKRLRGRTVAQLYAEGQRNFGGAILRGANLQGQMLVRADFSGADIRGANFEQAMLRKADFSHTKGGLPQPWGLAKVIVAMALLAAVGFWSAAVVTPIAAASVADYDPRTVIGVIFLVLPMILLLGKEVLLRLIVWVAGDGAQDLIMAAMISMMFPFLTAMLLLEQSATAVSLIEAIGNAESALIFFAAACFIAPVGFSVADGDYREAEFGDWFWGTLVTMAGVYGVAAGAEYAIQADTDGIIPVEIAFVVASAIAGLILFLCTYTYRWLGQSVQRPSPLRDWGLRLTTLGGTSFSEADLTGATFARASLKHTRFISARQPTVLTNVCWQDVKYRSRAWFVHSDQP